MARDPTYWIGTLSIALGAILPHLALSVIKFQISPEPYQVRARVRVRVRDRVS